MVSTEDIVAACTLLLLSCIALFSYVIAVWAIILVYISAKNAFYLLLLALGLSDIVMLSLFAFYSTTATFLQRPPLGASFDSLFCGSLCNVTYFTSLSLLVNIAFNRCLTICNKNASVVYDKRKISASIAACYAIGLVSAAPQMTPCCSLRYYEAAYAWSYDLALRGNAVYVWFDRSANLVTFACLIIAYSTIFVKVRKTRNAIQAIAESTSASQLRSADVHLALQTGLVSGLMIVFGLGFTVIPLLTSSKWWNLLSSVLYITAIGVHPPVYFAFNPLIRENALRLVSRKTVPQRITKNPVRNEMVESRLR